MNNKLIALAVATAMAAPLAAQAEVSISGQLQAEIVSMSGDGVVEGLYIEDSRERGAQNSGNSGFLKFSASEDLGGGLKAMAMYNMNIRASDTTGLPSDRDAYVGLSGGFGTVLAGRLSTPYKSSTVGWDPMLATGFQARGQYGMSTLHNSYADNVLAYANKFGNVKFVAAISLDESANTAKTETNGDHAMTFSVNAPVGPVEVALAYIDAGTTDATATKIGVKYSAGALGVAVQHEMLGKGITSNATSSELSTDDGTVTYANVTYTMGANTLVVALGDDQTYLTSSSTTDSYNGASNVKGEYMMVGVKHAFSKTTSGYVAYSSSDDVFNNDVSALGAGLRVKF